MKIEMNLYKLIQKIGISFFSCMQDFDYACTWPINKGFQNTLTIGMQFPKHETCEHKKGNREAMRTQTSSTHGTSRK